MKKNKILIVLEIPVYRITISANNKTKKLIAKIEYLFEKKLIFF